MKLRVRMATGRVDGDFPGYQAGASLKPPVGPVLASTVSPDFPGYQAGASLKHGAESVWDGDGEPTSPVTKPGPH